jgi:hypothetical protein
MLGATDNPVGVLSDPEALVAGRGGGGGAAGPAGGRALADPGGAWDDLRGQSGDGQEPVAAHLLAISYGLCDWEREAKLAVWTGARPVVSKGHDQSSAILAQT